VRAPACIAGQARAARDRGQYHIAGIARPPEPAPSTLLRQPDSEAEQQRRETFARPSPNRSATYQLRAGPRCEASASRARTLTRLTDLHLGVRVGTEVVQPTMLRMSALRSDKHEALAVRHIHQQRCAELATLGPDLIKQQQQRRGPRQASPRRPPDRGVAALSGASTNQRRSAMSR
jgi:hypothetical protein